MFRLSSLPLNLVDSDRPTRRSAKLLLATALAGLICSAPCAQDAVLPPAPLPAQSGLQTDASLATEAESSSLPDTATSTLPDTSVELNGKPVAETPRRFKYNFGLTVRGVYDDNINLSSVNRDSGYYIAIEPFVSLALGNAEEGFNYLNFTYRPSFFLFFDTRQDDTVQQIIHLDGERRFNRLSLSLAQDVQLLDGNDLNSISDPTGHSANIDVAARVRHQIYTTVLGIAYDLSGKIFLSGGGNFCADEYDTQISSQDYSGNVFVNYRYSDKVIIGLGGTGGYNTTEDLGSGGNDQIYEQANLRLSYIVTAKISLNASAGVEFRQFSGSSGGDQTSPVYELSASYQPFDGTSLTLTGSRHTANSAVLVGQDYAETTINFSVNQRLLQRVFLGLAVGYQNNDYFSTVNGIAATRNDDYYYVQPSVDVSVTRFWTVGAYYLYRQNDSSLQGFQFHNEQIGVRTSLTF